jgi:hypothetical protein
MDDDCTNIEFRIVESMSEQQKHHQQPIHPNPLSNYKAPLDTLFLSTSYNNNNSNNRDAMIEPTNTTFLDFMKLCVRPSTIESSDSDTEEDEEEYSKK